MTQHAATCIKQEGSKAKHYNMNGVVFCSGIPDGLEGFSVPLEEGEDAREAVADCLFLGPDILILF